VTAANNDGVWNDVGATLALTLLPAFYQTPWFLVLVSAACLGILWVLLWARLRQLTRKERMRLEQRMEDRLGERTRVARELHDTLLQSFQGLLLRFQVAYELLPARPTEAKQDLGNAIDRTVRAINEGRDAVQGLRASAFDYGSDVVFHVNLQGTPQPLLPLVRDEIYQIAGEALRNARRHAEASGIEVELRYDERQLRLRVRDDGKGIDARFLNGERATRHYGLHGLRERATLIGGELTIWTAAASGTEIELTVPAARAYATAPSTRPTWLLKRLSRKISEAAHE
jgi:signal transduction histidine kinase